MPKPKSSKITTQELIKIAYYTVIPRSGSMFGITWLLGPTSCLKIAVNDLGHIYSDQQVSGTHFGTKIRPIGPSDQKL